MGSGAVSGSAGAAAAAAPLFPPRAGFFSGVDFWTPLERFLGDSSLSSLAPAGDGDRFLLGGESAFLVAAAAAFPRPLLGAGAASGASTAGCSSSALAAAALAAAAPLPLLAGAAATSSTASAATGDLAAIGQVWSLTQFYSVDFTIKDRCRKVGFQQTHNQGSCQLLMKVSWDLCT